MNVKNKKNNKNRFKTTAIKKHRSKEEHRQAFLDAFEKRKFDSDQDDDSENDEPYNQEKEKKEKMGKAEYENSSDSNIDSDDCDERSPKGSPDNKRKKTRKRSGQRLQPTPSSMLAHKCN